MALCEYNFGLWFHITFFFHLNGHIFRAEIALTDGRLMGVSRELNVTADLDNALKRNLTALEKELKDLNNTLHRLQRELKNYHTAGLAGKVVFFNKL